MSVEIYYFSGTGNSLHVAKELGKRLPGAKLIPILAVLDDDMIATGADTVGLVFPLYLTTVPAPVRRFLEKLDVSSASYLFSVVTRGGSFSVANINVDRILRKKGKALDAGFVLDMVINTPTGIKPGPGDENWPELISAGKVKQLDAGVRSGLDLMRDVILARETYPKDGGPGPFMSLLERIMCLLTRNTGTQIAYYTDETCTGCGTCERVCLSGKIRLHARRPEWRKDVKCHYCYACFNYCPEQAILVRNKYTRKDGRYSHPGIGAAEIAGQKPHGARSKANSRSQLRNLRKFAQYDEWIRTG